MTTDVTIGLVVIAVLFGIPMCVGLWALMVSEIIELRKDLRKARR